MKRTKCMLLAGLLTCVVTYLAWATVSSQTTKVYFTCNGSTTTFSCTGGNKIPCFASTDIEVYVRTDSTGDEVPLTLTTDYSVAALNNDYTNGFTVTMNTAPASGRTLVVKRAIALTQEVNLIRGRNIPREPMERTLDRQMLALQDSKEELGRSLRIPVTDSSYDMNLPSSIGRANKYLAFDSDGDVLLATGTASDPPLPDLTDYTATIKIADIITKSPWFDVRAFILSGSGTSGDPWIIDDISSYANVYFYVAGYYKLSANWNIVSNSHIWGTKGVFLNPDVYTLECSGTISATTTDFTADGAKGAMALTVADESSFSADDWIEISVSKDVYPDWAVKALPVELNRVLSTAANTINLKYPLQRLYDYDAGYADNPTVTKITTLKENVVVENIYFQGTIDFQYVHNLAIRGITLTYGELRFSGCVKSFEMTNTEVNRSPATSGTTIKLVGSHEGILSVRTHGLKTGLRLWGCSQITGSAIVKQCNQRAVWLYGSEDIHLSPVTVMGTKTNVDNIEIILFDRCGSCSIRNAFVKEPNKTLEAAVVEFRASKGWCEFTDSEIYCYSYAPISIKVESLQSVIDRNKFHIVSGVTSVIRLFSGVVTYSESIIKVRDNEVIYAGDYAHLIRTSSGEDLTGNDIKYVEISGNRVPLTTNIIMCYLKGVVGTKGIETLKVTNNTVSVASPGSTGLYNSDNNFPITNLIFHGNTVIGATGGNYNFANVTNITFDDNNIETVTTGSPVLTFSGTTQLDSSGGAITGTLADGAVVGQTKTITMTDATTSSTVSVAHHTTSDPEVFTFAQVGDTLILMWNGTDWMTVFNNGAAV